MASPAVKKGLWLAAAAAAAAFLVALSLSGERPVPGMTASPPAGIFAAIPDRQVRQVIVVSPVKRASFERDGDGAWRSGGLALDPASSAQLQTAWRVGRVAVIERRMSASDIAGVPVAQFGLDRPVLIVTIVQADGGKRTVRFGGANPLGVSVYAQIEGEEGVLLLPGHVLSSWQATLGPP